MKFQARRSGAMVLAGNLPSFIDQMDVLPSRFTVMAHSMGNVVVSEAMRTWGSQANKIGKYLAMMSAESAGAYRYDATPIGTYLGNGTNGIGPDVYRHANPQNPRNRLSVTWDRITKPFEPLDATLDGPVYYSGGFARSFGETRTYFRDNEAATGNSWVGTQNTRIDSDFAYRRILEPGAIEGISPDPIYRDFFEQEKYHVPPFDAWPRQANGHRLFAWRFAPSNADEIAQNAAVMVFVVGSRTTAVGATRNMNMSSVGYPNQECLFGALPVDLENDFKVGDGSGDHSFPWNCWSAKTWSMHQHLIGVMP